MAVNRIKNCDGEVDASEVADRDLYVRLYYSFLCQRDESGLNVEIWSDEFKERVMEVIFYLYQENPFERLSIQESNEFVDAYAKQHLQSVREHELNILKKLIANCRNKMKKG